MKNKLSGIGLNAHTPEYIGFLYHMKNGNAPGEFQFASTPQDLVQILMNGTYDFGGDYGSDGKLFSDNVIRDLFSASLYGFGVRDFLVEKIKTFDGEDSTDLISQLDVFVDLLITDPNETIKMITSEQDGVMGIFRDPILPLIFVNQLSAAVMFDGFMQTMSYAMALMSNTIVEEDSGAVKIKNTTNQSMDIITKAGNLYNTNIN